MTVADPAAAALAEATQGRRPSGGMLRYTVRRVLTALGTVVFVIVVNFVLFRLLPGDPIGLYTRGRNVSAQQLVKLREQLNRPFLEQFLTYIRNPFSSTLSSTKYNQPVWDVIYPHIWPTVLLLGVSTILSTVIGIWLGIRSGWGRGTRFDQFTTGWTLILYAMPEFWLGMLLLLVFTGGTLAIPDLFPVNGMVTPGVDTSTPAGWLDVAWHLVLPATTLTLAYLAEYSLVMRSSLLDELGEDYLVTARAKGLRDAQVRRRHAVPNALLPTVTLIFLNIGFIVSGAITVETVYSWPGLGLLSYDALRGPDVPLLQALFLLFSLSVVLFNVIADVLYAVLDPRVRT